MASTFSEITENLTRLNTIVQQLNRLDRDVSGDDEGASHRSDMKRLRVEGQENIKKTKGLLTQPFDRAQRARHDKLQTQFTDVSTQFEKISKVTIKKEMERRLSELPTPNNYNNNNTTTTTYNNSNNSSSSNYNNNTNNNYNNNYNNNQQQQQQQGYEMQQMQKQTLVVDDMLIEERNQEIKSLENELVQLSEVFTDVLKLTQEQGQDLKIVHDNVASAEAYTVEGTKDLKKASRYACGYRKKLVILAIIIMAVIAAIIIIAVIVTRRK